MPSLSFLSSVFPLITFLGTQTSKEANPTLLSPNIKQPMPSSKKDHMFCVTERTRKISLPNVFVKLTLPEKKSKQKQNFISTIDRYYHLVLTTECPFFARFLRYDLVLITFSNHDPNHFTPSICIYDRLGEPAVFLQCQGADRTAVQIRHFLHEV